MLRQLAYAYGVPPDTPAPAQTQGDPTMNNPVGWFEIYVDDMPRAKAFYETVFGAPLTRLETPEDPGSPDLEMWAFPMQDNAYGAAGALVRMPGFRSGGNSVLVYFHCADCAVEAARSSPPAARSSATSFPSATTASSPWPWIRKAT
jgi:predicted enzyme related to lactoylglutathione lyase